MRPRSRFTKPYGSSGPELLHYLLAYLAAVTVDSIPVVAPPAWMVLVVLMIQLQLNPWILIPVGVAGTVTGRLILMTYISWLGRKTLSESVGQNLQFLGRKLSQSRRATFFFILLYSLSPFSTTALFSAAGIAKLSRKLLVPPFAIGKLISYAVLLHSSRAAAVSVRDLVHGALSWRTALVALASLLAVLLFLALDWVALLERKKLKFQFRVWR